MDGMLGVKLGMTQRFATNGRVIPVTLIRVRPCVVLQKKTMSKDGYSAVQIGLEHTNRGRRLPRAMAARLKAAGAPASASVSREFRTDDGNRLTVGSRIGVNFFAPDDRVRVTGVSKGKGFSGVMKRHGFHGGPKSHGSKFHRAPGAIGMCATPSRVLPGTRLPGHQGHARVTVRNLRVVEVDTSQDLLAVCGAVPGPCGGAVEIRKA